MKSDSHLTGILLNGHFSFQSIAGGNGEVILVIETIDLGISIWEVNLLSLGGGAKVQLPQNGPPLT